MNFELRTIPSKAMKRSEVDEVITLCSYVFQLDCSYFMNLYATRVHVLGYVDGLLVTHALWLNRSLQVGDGPWLNSAYVEGVATHIEYQGLGFGSALMRHLQTEIAGYDLGALSPDVPEWYTKLGWERWRGPLRVLHGDQTRPTPSEHVLVYRTPHSPALDLNAPLTAPWRPSSQW